MDERQSGHYENDIYDNSSETEECAESVLKIDKFSEVKKILEEAGLSHLVKIFMEKEADDDFLSTVDLSEPANINNLSLLLPKESS